MGTVQGALSRPDAFSVFVNPALITDLPADKLEMARTNLFADASLTAAAYSGTYHKRPYLLAIRWLSYGDLQRIDGSGTVQGTVRSYDGAFSVTSGQRLTDRISAGVEAGFAFSRYDALSASALLGSAGLMFADSLYKFRASLSVVHGGRLVDGFSGERPLLFSGHPSHRLPSDVRLSLSKKPEYVPVMLFATFRSLNRYPLRLQDEVEIPPVLLALSRHFSGGAELLFSENFVVRLGLDKYRHDQFSNETQFDRAGVNVGFGLNFKKFSMDFSRSNYSTAGYVFQFAARTTF